MIRVVFRDENWADGVLVGDFPPGDIPELLELFGETLFFDGENDTSKPHALYTQLILAGSQNQRVVLEIIGSYEG